MRDKNSFEWLVANVHKAWRHRDRLGDAIKRLIWIYAAKIPTRLRPVEQEIGFRYPAPIGLLRLLVRSNSGSDAFIFSEVFEQRCYEIRLPASPETILDLGGNAGYSCVYFAKAWPRARIAVVEPVPDNLRVLRRNLALNCVGAQVIDAAVAVEDGSVQMNLGPMDYSHRVTAWSDTDNEERIRVTAMSIDTILRELGWRRIGLLKVDIEGYEHHLFERNCDWLHLVDTMRIEWHHDGGAERLNMLAQRYGFRKPESKGGVWTLMR